MRDADCSVCICLQSMTDHILASYNEAGLTIHEHALAGMYHCSRVLEERVEPGAEVVLAAYIHCVNTPVK